MLRALPAPEGDTSATQLVNSMVQVLLLSSGLPMTDNAYECAMQLQIRYKHFH